MLNIIPNNILADLSDLLTPLAIFIFVALSSVIKKIEKKGEKPKSPTQKPKASITPRATRQPTVKRNLPSYARKASQARQPQQPSAKPRPTLSPRPAQPQTVQKPRSTQQRPAPRPAAKPTARPTARPTAKPAPRPVARPTAQPAARTAPKPQRPKPVIQKRRTAAPQPKAGRPGTTEHCHKTQSRKKIEVTQKSHQTSQRKNHYRKISAAQNPADLLHNIVKTDNELVRAIVYSEIFNKPKCLIDDPMA